MLYVFRVDTGTMLQLEMNLALETVQELKEAIERTCRIPPVKQVLLVSGGECLELTTRVCTYSAGTDTNPIFLFSKDSQDNRSLSPSADDASEEDDITGQVEASLDLPATYNTVVARSTLAQTLSDLGKDLSRDCERLIYDQHLQQQGWAAAVANLEDMASFFRERSIVFQKDYHTHLEVREENLAILKNFNDDLQTLARIPILPPLLASAISASGLELETKVTTMTLLEWISAKDNQSSLQAVAEQCTSFLEQLDESVLESLVKNVETALQLAEKVDMKEIKGLTERLCGLEGLMQRARRIVQEQSELAKSFQQNQLRASNIGDTSILPPLCTSHRRQLLVMLENQTKLKDIRRRCLKAKEELSVNLKHRLRWVAYAQNEMLIVGNNLLIYQESLKRGRRHFLIVQQVQRAPEMYCLAVAEVVRRRTFSRAYLSWSKDLSNRLLATYNEESERRREFKEQFCEHFLKALFPGLDDEPSSFATNAPEPFDNLLPDLTLEDMETLRGTLPDLALGASWTELSNVAQMILSKNQSECKEESKEGLPVEDRLVAAVTQVGLADKMDETLLRPDDSSKTKDDKDVESETDTDEFEKVSQSPLDRKLVQSEIKPRLSDSMRQRITEAARLSVEITSSLRAELLQLQGQTVADKDHILSLAKEIQSHVSQLTEGFVEELATTHERLKQSEQEAELKAAAMSQVIEEKNSALISLENEKETIRAEAAELNERLNQTIPKLNAEIAELKETHAAELEKLENEKQNMIAQAASEKIALEEHSSKTLQEAQTKFQDELQALKTKELELVAQFQTKEAELKNLIQRLEEEKSELTERLIKTELSAEVELENRGKELEMEHAKACAELEERLKEIHQQEIQELTERVTNEYKSELANLRGRFRFMSMEKSPSDLSLEKVERGDVIELANHEAILEQAKEDAQEALEKAVAEAIENEKIRSRERIEEELAAARIRMEEEKLVWLDEAVERALAERDRKAQEESNLAKLRLEEEKQLCIKEAVDLAIVEKDKQIEALITKQQTLVTESQRHRDTIRLLREGEHRRSGAGTVGPLLERIERLEKERKELIDEVNWLKDVSHKRRLTSIDEDCFSDLGSSGISLGSHSSDDMALSVMTEFCASPEFSRKDLNKMDKSVNNTTISLNGCGPNDIVVVIWNSELANYVILQESPTWYILRSDCLDTLGLRPSSDGSPRKLYTLAIVINKEYCNAKKAENRYRVPKGTKFYRVLVKPIPKDLQSTSMLSYPTEGGSSS